MSDIHSPDRTQAVVDTDAREKALAATAQVAVSGTSRIEFISHGRLVIIGPAERISTAAPPLEKAGLKPCLLETTGTATNSAANWPVLDAAGKALEIDGHMGAFRVLTEGREGPISLGALIQGSNEYFDLILDLSETPLVDLEVPPLGYFAPGTDPVLLEQAMRELPQLVGEFEKPRYFEYDPDICAHSRSGIPGCRRCLEACPTGAIASLGERIDVDPYHCQGGGSCATACPTGAIVYSYPRPGDLQNRLRRLLRTYREAGGRSPVLLFCDGETMNHGLEEPLPGHIVPIEVEEVGNVGLDTWLTSLSFGAASVVLVDSPRVPDRVRREIDEQLKLVTAILSGLGYPSAVGRHHGEPGDGGIKEILTRLETMPELPPAGFLGTSAKRDMIFLALDHLAAHAPAGTKSLAMPGHAPFGDILIDRERCTLCMACVSVCPASALSDGVDKPELGFIEGNCVQCGLCASACPEDAITLSPRLIVERHARKARRVLHSESPMACIVCGTPFATRSVIERMTARLSEHRMFQDDDALRRLKMCQDCRVRDMFEAERRE